MVFLNRALSQSPEDELLLQVQGMMTYVNAVASHRGLFLPGIQLAGRFDPSIGQCFIVREPVGLHVTRVKEFTQGMLLTTRSGLLPVFR